MSDGTDGDDGGGATDGRPRSATEVTDSGTAAGGRRDTASGDPEYDVPSRPSIGDRLVGGAADKPVLAVFVVILLVLAVGFLAASLFVAAQFLGLL
ncbi:hypothetical protein RYH80_14325 [Halobaculum sp. MBLA0147]|uniref:hypothetical protein n=1 Tax=Halobaculum sp. MBLA0147 TaxID=3079934 RepID=UPI0035265D46